MDIYKLIVQQYKDYKIEKVTLYTKCDTCPCKTLRDKIFGTHKLRKECLQEMIYLVDKYKISGANVFSCNSCMLTSVKIAKKMAERNNRV